MEANLLEQKIAKKYERMIGKPAPGLVDTLRILSSDDIRRTMFEYLNSKEDAR